jgi:hypothetical protein
MGKVAVANVPDLGIGAGPRVPPRERRLAVLAAIVTVVLWASRSSVSAPRATSFPGPLSLDAFWSAVG